MGTSGSGPLLLARLVDPSYTFVLPSQLLQHVRAESWQGLLAKAVFAATYGAGIFMTYRALREYLRAKVAEVAEDRSLKTRLWAILREWDEKGEFTPLEFETEEQDDDGVVMHRTRTGSTIFFRQGCQGVPGHDEGFWEWSRDCQDWVPTFDLKKLELRNGCRCTSSTCFPSDADKTFILRLEVERRLRQRVGVPGPRSSITRSLSSPHPPPLDPPGSLSVSWEAPEEFLCPITLQLMSEPVISPSGITYNLPGIAKWISNHHTDPATGQALQAEWLIPNLTLRNIIQKWLVEHSMAEQEGSEGLTASSSAPETAGTKEGSANHGISA